MIILNIKQYHINLLKKYIFEVEYYILGICLIFSCIEGSFPEQSETKQIEFKTSSVSKITKNTVIFEDGTEDSYDIIIYATGYRNCFPFFDPADKIIEFENGGDRGQYFGPLYRKLFSINYPDIIFIGLVERASTLYITFERQALLAKQYILGELQLPSKADMLSSLEDEKKVCIDYHNSLSKFYYIDNTETYSFIDYHRDLCKLTNLPINDHFFQNVIKSEEAVQIIYDTGIACRIKAIDWTSVFGDFDYFSTSDQF